MGRQTIKDVAGRLLGSIDTNPNGHERVYDVRGQMVGSYDPQNNITKTATGELLFKGNALSALILRQRR